MAPCWTFAFDTCNIFIAALRVIVYVLLFGFHPTGVPRDEYSGSDCADDVGNPTSNISVVPTVVCYTVFIRYKARTCIYYIDKNSR